MSTETAVGFPTVSDADTHDPSAPSALPRGSVVPGADIWDDTDDPGADVDDHEFEDVVDLDTRREIARSRQAEADWDDERWLGDAQVVAHVDDDGVHDGSRGVEADDDADVEAFGTKLQRWGTTSMLGASLSGIGIGIDKVLRPRDPIQIEIQVDDDSDDRLDPVEVKLGNSPDESVALLRPWLRRRGSTDGPVGD